jgi:outer membrane protein
MHLKGTCVYQYQNGNESGSIAKPEMKYAGRKNSGNTLRAVAALMLSLLTGLPSGFAQQAVSVDTAASELPSAPAPKSTETLTLRSTQRDFTKPSAAMWGNPINVYRPTTIAKSSFANSVRLSDLIKDGKIYLSLSDALALALENNYDIAIARYYLDIADTDILRTKTGAAYRGVGATVLTNTLGGTSQTLSTSGAPGGTSSGAATGSSGLVLTTDGTGPTPESLDPTFTGTIQFERMTEPQANTLFSGGLSKLTTNTNEYNFAYSQGFTSGTQLSIALNNSRITTDNPNSNYSPELTSAFKATVTQHLLQGAGFWVNKRYMYEAKLNRRLTDSTFRQQILYTVNQVENIYWALVSSYDDTKAKERALEQSTKVLNDDKKQLEIGTVAPLQVVSDESAVATDKQALINSKNNLAYQQLVIKQAITRNLNDPTLVAAEVIPTDRVTLEVLSEENQPDEDLVKQAFQNRPELEQAVLAIQKDEITLRGARKALLPTLDVYGFYNSSALGGSQNPNYVNIISGSTDTSIESTGYGTVLQNLFNSSAPDKGIGFNLSIPLRNRTAQADQARSLIEYRQAELHLEQLYTQIHMQVVNAKIALNNYRELVKSSMAARDYNKQSLEAEQKKLRLGASTSANVLTQERNLATAENSLNSALASYAQARASLYQMLASTLQHYGINLNDATMGDVKTAPVIPGLETTKTESAKETK